MGLFVGSKKTKWMESLPKRISSSAMILENSIGQLLIVKANYKPYWTLPGGIIDPKETPKEAAVRETYEEVGIKIEPDQVEFVAVANRHSETFDTYQFIFKAPLKPEAIDRLVLQTTEIDGYTLVTKDQVKSGDRRYGKVIEHWAFGRTGYLEQTFGKENDA